MPQDKLKPFHHVHSTGLTLGDDQKEHLLINKTLYSFTMKVDGINTYPLQIYRTSNLRKDSDLKSFKHDKEFELCRNGEAVTSLNVVEMNGFVYLFSLSFLISPSDEGRQDRIYFERIHKF